MGQLLLKLSSTENFEIVLGSREDFKVDYPIRIFSLTKANEILENLKDIKLVINLAGPFKNTNKQLVEACIKKWITLHRHCRRST